MLKQFLAEPLPHAFLDHTERLVKDSDGIEDLIELYFQYPEDQHEILWDIQDLILEDLAFTAGQTDLVIHFSCDKTSKVIAKVRAYHEKLRGMLDVPEVNAHLQWPAGYLEHRLNSFSIFQRFVINQIADVTNIPIEELLP